MSKCSLFALAAKAELNRTELNSIEAKQTEPNEPN